MAIPQPLWVTHFNIKFSSQCFFVFVCLFLMYFFFSHITSWLPLHFNLWPLFLNSCCAVQLRSWLHLLDDFLTGTSGLILAPPEALSSPEWKKKIIKKIFQPSVPNCLGCPLLNLLKSINIYVFIFSTGGPSLDAIF